MLYISDEQISLIPCLLTRKALITEGLVADYSPVIGRFLEKFIVESGDLTSDLDCAEGSISMEDMVSYWLIQALIESESFIM